MSSRKDVAGSGIMARRGSAAYTSIHQKEKEIVDNPCEGLWVYPEVMDVVALASAMCLSISTATMFSYKEDIEPADVRFIEYHKSLDKKLYVVSENEEHPVSKGLMTYSILGGVFGAFSLVLAVSVRIILTYVTNMKTTSKKRQFLLKWANPLAVLDILVWTVSVSCTIPLLYFVAWVVFPAEIASHPVLWASGSMLIVLFFMLLLLFIYIGVIARRIGREEEQTENQKDNQSKHF